MASIADTLAAVRAMKERVLDAADTVAQKGAEITLEEKVAALDEGTYSKRIPTNAERRRGTLKAPSRKASSAASKPAWERSGRLRDDQRVENRGHGKRAVVNGGASAVYEPRVANLPTGPDGINRSNDAAPKAQKRAEKRLPQLVADELTRAVRG